MIKGKKRMINGEESKIHSDFVLLKLNIITVISMVDTGFNHCLIFLLLPLISLDFE